MINRYAAQAVTVDGYGDPAIVIMEIATVPGDGLDGQLGEVDALTIDGDFTAEADLDHALTGAGFTRVSGWEPCDFGSIATVTREEG